MTLFQDYKERFLEAHFDGLSSNMVRGWIYDIKNISDVISVDLFINGCFHKTVEAKQFRLDLLAAHKGNQGQCAFEIPIDLSSFNEKNIKIELFTSGEDKILFGLLNLPHGRPVTFALASKRMRINQFKTAIVSSVSDFFDKLGRGSESAPTNKEQEKTRIDQSDIYEKYKFYFDGLKSGIREKNLTYFFENEALMEPALRCLLMRMWPDTPVSFLRYEDRDLNFTKIMLDFHKNNTREFDDKIK